MKEKNGFLAVTLVDSDGNAAVALGTIAAGTAGAASSDVLSVQGVAGGTPVEIVGATGYQAVAAGQTAKALGATGALGDYLERLIITPATTAGGVVTLLDGATPIPLYVGGATTVLADVRPITVEIGAKSVSGAWKVTTGANISVLAIGRFTA